MSVVTSVGVVGTFPLWRSREPSVYPDLGDCGGLTDEMLLVCVVLFCVVFVSGGSRNLEETSPRNCQHETNRCC